MPIPVPQSAKGPTLRTTTYAIEPLEQRALLDGSLPIKAPPPATPTADLPAAAPIMQEPSLDGDTYEPNDTQAGAFNLKTLRSMTLSNLSIHAADNDDYFRFVAGADGTLGVDVSFVNADGNIDISLLDSGGNVLASSNGTTDTEHLSASVTRGVSYWVRVYGVNSATNPDYTLTLSGPSVAPDALEVNDSPSNPFDLVNCGLRTWDNLNIHTAENSDFYRFVAQASGPANIQIDFANSDGDLDMVVYNSKGAMVGSSDSRTDNETVNLSVVKGEHYLIRIYGYAGDINWNYTLSVDAPIDSNPPTVTSAYYDYNVGAGVAVSFSEQMLDIGTSDFSFYNQSLAHTLPQPDFYSNGDTTRGWIGYDSPMPDGNYLMTLDSNGICDLGYNHLDGNGDGVAGDNYQLPFFVLNGDANRDRHVDSLDFDTLAFNFNKSGMSFGDGDFNHDGQVNALDFNTLATRFGTVLPPPAGASLEASTPTSPSAAAVPFASLFSSNTIHSDAALSDVLGTA